LTADRVCWVSFLEKTTLGPIWRWFFAKDVTKFWPEYWPLILILLISALVFWGPTAEYTIFPTGSSSI
jgi:hypothetical protein